MTIIANDIVSYKDFVDTHAIEMVSKAEIMAFADIVTVHTPLDNSTRGMINEERLRRVKCRRMS